MAADFGACIECGKNNSFSATRCYGCSSILPWAQAQLDKAAAKAKDSTAKRQAKVATKIAAPRVEIDFGYWAIGLFVTLVSFGVPPLGYFLYRYFSADDSDLAGFARAGLYMVVIGWALLFVGHMALAGNATKP